jgi:hypothetical protein
MAQDISANGVQVVGGSNPPCPTNHNPNPTNNFAVSAETPASLKSGCEPSFAPSRVTTTRELPKYSPSPVVTACPKCVVAFVDVAPP